MKTVPSARPQLASSGDARCKSIIDEDILPLTKAAEHFAGRPHINTIRRWATRGVVVDGVLRKLESFREGITPYTSRQAIRRFLQPAEEAELVGVGSCDVTDAIDRELAS